MKLGLLHEVDGPQRATLREQPSYLSFSHKSLQEMEASKFVTQELETSQDIKVKKYSETTMTAADGSHLLKCVHLIT